MNYPKAKARWCLVHPKDGLVPWTMSILPETYVHYCKRHRGYFNCLHPVYRIVRVDITPRGPLRQPKGQKR